MKRDDPKVKAERARQLFENQAFREAYDSLKGEIIANLEKLQLDGSPEKEQLALELQRQLNLLTRMRAAGMRPIMSEHLREKQSLLKRAKLKR